jgi:hypothetical protein
MGETVMNRGHLRKIRVKRNLTTSSILNRQARKNKMAFDKASKEPGDIVLYHGTSNANALKARKSGLKASLYGTSKLPIGMSTLTTNRRYARLYGRSVLKVTIPRKQMPRYLSGGTAEGSWGFKVKHRSYGLNRPIPVRFIT